MTQQELFGSNDITFCVNKACPLRSCCRRAFPPKDSEWVSFSEFQLHEDGSCDYLMEIKR